MPQFEFSNFLPQMVWLAIFFAILYFGVVSLTLPKIGKVVTAREDRISGDLDAAERAKNESDRMAADYDQGVTAAQEAARTAVNAARTRAQAALEAKLNDSNAALNAHAAEAQASLDAARTAALSEIEHVAADAAADIVERFTGTRPATPVAAQAVQAALG